jgi:endonuclease YncB( thermonuclease family)
MTFALLLLLAALGFFIVATHQFKQPERFLIWLIGAVVLAWSGLQVLTERDHYGLLRAFADAWTGTTLVHAFSANAETIAQYIPQLLDVFLVLAGVLGLFVLASFTPGDEMERLARPALLILIGAMLGGVATLAVVAIGLGGQMRPRTYLGYVSEQDVFDGDTLRMGNVSLRLLGVDAPELHQPCRGIDGQSVDDCGQWARANLIALVDGALIQCDQRESRSGRLMENFGRPLVRCWVRPEDAAPFDLGRRMIEDGYAVTYMGDHSYGYEDAEAAGSQRNLMRGCMLRPDLWRTDNAARRAFEANDTLPPDAVRGQRCWSRPPEDLEGAPTHGPVGIAPTLAPPPTQAPVEGP